MKLFFAKLRADWELTTNEELWQTLGVSRDAAQAWMAGRRPPSRYLGEQVARKANYTYADLLNIYYGERSEVDPAAVIAALEWAISQVRSGEWTPMRPERTGAVPRGTRAAVERLAGRSKAQRPSGRPTS